jgi:hypothetical protein
VDLFDFICPPSMCICIVALTSKPIFQSRHNFSGNNLKFYYMNAGEVYRKYGKSTYFCVILSNPWATVTNSCETHACFRDEFSLRYI